jgi:hypothetical protein
MRMIYIVSARSQNHQCEGIYLGVNINGCWNNDWKAMISSKCHSFGCRLLQKCQLLWPLGRNTCPWDIIPLGWAWYLSGPFSTLSWLRPTSKQNIMFSPNTLQFWMNECRILSAVLIFFMNTILSELSIRTH